MLSCTQLGEGVSSGTDLVASNTNGTMSELNEYSTQPVNATGGLIIALVISFR